MQERLIILCGLSLFLFAAVPARAVVLTLTIDQSGGVFSGRPQ